MDPLGGSSTLEQERNRPLSCPDPVGTVGGGTRELFERSPVPKMIVAQDGLRILAVNRAASELYAASAAELCAMNLADLEVPGGSPDALARLGGASPPHVRHEVAGSVRWMELEARAIEACGRPAWLVVLLDVTERHALREALEQRRLENELMLADRLASVSTLAAGVAHEINNPLAFVVANLAFAAREIEDLRANHPALSARLSDLTDALAEAQIGADRVRSVVLDLKVFARAGTDQVAPVDVHAVLESAVKMASGELRQRARLVRSYDRRRLVADGNEGRLGQVFLNLLVNAAQAIPEGKPDAGEVRLSTELREGGWIAVEVHDNGAGMDPWVRARLFEPFFTTRPAGTGSGLGLAVADGIVKSMGGRIEVESTPGEGSTFRVFLRVSASQPVASPSAGRVRVLVVDDEPGIGAAIVRLLPECDVTTCTSGEEALLRINAGERFDVIFSDLLMPGVNGQDLLTQLEREVPDQAARFVFLTGGGFDGPAGALLASAPRPCIDKPFEVQQLREAIARITRR